MAGKTSTAVDGLTKVNDFLAGDKTASTIPWDPDCTKFPKRKDVPRREDAPEEAAWVWGVNDGLGRLNLLTPTRVKAASREIQSGVIVPLNLPLDVPKVPALGREPFEHRFKRLREDGIAFDDTYELNTQSGTQWDGFRHMAHMSTQNFYNGVKAEDIDGPNRDPQKCGIHHWAEHGIAGRGILLDYWGYAKEKGIIYDPYDHFAISWHELQACGKAQGINIQPAAQGGDVQIGDLLFIRSGFVSAYHSKSPEELATIASNDQHGWAGVKQEEVMKDWLHDCYFSAVAGDAPAFEAWPSPDTNILHGYLLALWGVPIGEMFDLEKLAKTCKEAGRWSFFVTSSPNHCVGGIASHANAQAIF